MRRSADTSLAPILFKSRYSAGTFLTGTSFEARRSAGILLAEMPLAVGFLDAVSAGSDLVGAFIGSGFAATTFEDSCLTRSVSVFGFEAADCTLEDAQMRRGHGRFRYSLSVLCGAPLAAVYRAPQRSAVQRSAALCGDTGRHRTYRSDLRLQAPQSPMRRKAPHPLPLFAPRLQKDRRADSQTH